MMGAILTGSHLDTRIKRCRETEMIKVPPVAHGLNVTPVAL